MACGWATEVLHRSNASVTCRNIRLTLFAFRFCFAVRNVFACRNIVFVYFVNGSENFKHKTFVCRAETHQSTSNLNKKDDGTRLQIYLLNLSHKLYLSGCIIAFAILPSKSG